MNFDLDESPEDEKELSKLSKLLQDPLLMNEISTPVTASAGELLLMIIKFVLQFGLSFEASSSLCRMINNIFRDPILPESKYMLDKLFHPKSNVEFHAVCPSCSEYLGKIESLCDKNIKECKVCETSLDVTHPSSTSFFVLIDPSEQIANYLSQNEDYYDWVIQQRQHDPQIIKDFYDGLQYQAFRAKLVDKDKCSYVTLMKSADGAPAFESSQYSIWPVELVINELPMKQRFRNLITFGLWFGKSEPVMTIYLTPLVDKLNLLTENGITVPIKGEIRSIKPYVLVGVYDSPARSACNGTVRFNGKHGCDWCLHETHFEHKASRYSYLQKKSTAEGLETDEEEDQTSNEGNRDEDDVEEDRVLNQPIPIERTMEKMINWCEEASVEKKAVFGVKSMTALYFLKNFDIITSIVPDYMHLALLGVGKSFVDEFLKVLSSTELEVLDDLMKKIRSPYQIARYHRSLKARVHWKAREWENFLLYYSIPLFTEMFDEAYVKHFSLFVDGLYTLLKSEITRQNSGNEHKVSRVCS